MAETKRTLDQRIADAAVGVAKAAIASPGVYPQWGRLHDAAEKLRKAQAEHAAALAAWRDLIAAAPPEWAKLAPEEPHVSGVGGTDA